MQEVPQPLMYSLEEIKKAITNPKDIIDAMAECFKVYSKNQAHVAPVIHLGSPEPDLTGGGSVCVKTGYFLNKDYYVVKIAGGGFKDSSNSGAMLIFSQRTGHLKAVLADRCELTELRTAAAGALSVREMGPSVVECIGVLGNGVQARYQLEMLRHVTPCRKVIVCGRSVEKLKKFVKIMGKEWDISYTTDSAKMAAKCNVIVTVTSASQPLIHASSVQRGTHFVCVGADSHGKQELDPMIVAKANCVVVDSIKQCVEIGEVQHALKESLISREKLIEMGSFLGKKRRRRDSDVTVFDSTGVAVQDVAIAEMAFRALQNQQQTMHAKL